MGDKMLNLRNNFIMSAVKTGYGDLDGNISDRHIAFWDKRSKHVGAVIFEPFYIDKKVRELPTQIGINSDEKIEGLKKLAGAVQKNGALAVAHINHPGRMANPKLPGNIYLSASDVACPNGGQTPTPMNNDDIKIVQEQFVNAALRAEKAGYDAIELQFGLGYLIAQFLNPVTNRRGDQYGGDFKSRARFGLEILRKIKENVKLPVIVRISGDEKADGGLTMDDSLNLMKLLENEDPAAVHVTSGNACASPPWYYQHHFIPKGKTWEMAKVIKEKFSLPVITVGQVTDKEDLDKILNEGYADYIAIGRALIADPDFVGKYLGETDGNIRPCSSCLTGCLGRIKVGKGLQCEINPEVGRELEPLIPAKEQKKYAVIGGGMAGMEAALTLKQRGHDVTIFEKDKLGGQFNLAPLPSDKGSLQKQIDYLAGEVKEIPVVYKEANAEDLVGKFDGAVVATGSIPVIPPITGLKEYKWAEILYETNIPKEKNVLIIGGGLIGIEVAATLINYENKVTVVEMLDDVARDMEMVSKKLNLARLEKGDVKILTGTKVTRVEEKEVFISDQNNDEKKLGNFDIIVIAAGMRPERSLIKELEGKIPLYPVGDSNEVGDVVSAIQSAWFTAKEL